MIEIRFKINLKISTFRMKSTLKKINLSNRSIIISIKKMTQIIVIGEKMKTSKAQMNQMNNKMKIRVRIKILNKKKKM